MNRYAAILRVYQAHRGATFRWGKNDCLAFVIACAEAIGCGNDLVRRRAEFQYASEAEANAIMVAQGWRGLGDLAASLWNCIPVAQAQTGDWALIVNDGGAETLGVVVRDTVVAQTAKGAGVVPLRQARSAYRVSAQAKSRAA